MDIEGLGSRLVVAPRGSLEGVLHYFSNPFVPIPRGVKAGSKSLSKYVSSVRIFIGINVLNPMPINI